MSIRFIWLLPVLLLGVWLDAAVAQSMNTAKDLVQKSAVSTEFGIVSSQLAVEKAQTPEIKALAGQILDAQRNTASRLRAVLPSSTISPALMVTTLDAKYQRIFTDLKTATPESFDSMYRDDQLEALDTQISYLQDYASGGDDTILKNYAVEVLPLLQQLQDLIKKFP